MNTIPIIPNGIGHILNSSSLVNISITAITTITSPIQKLNLFRFSFLVPYKFILLKTVQMEQIELF
jgi:hypothetical protein